MKKILFVVLMTIPSIALAAVMAPKAGSGEVKFTATASPGALTINGKSETPTGTLDIAEDGSKIDVSGSLKIKLDTFSTGIALRDSHMKGKYLEAEKYPEALLLLSKQALPKNGAGPFEGELVLHGMKHKVTGMAEIKPEGAGSFVKASFPVRLQDHGIVAPSFAGISVADEVSVETQFLLSSKPN